MHHAHTHAHKHYFTCIVQHHVQQKQLSQVLTQSYASRTHAHTHIDSPALPSTMSSKNNRPRSSHRVMHHAHTHAHTHIISPALPSTMSSKNIRPRSSHRVMHHAHTQTHTMIHLHCPAPCPAKTVVPGPHKE